MKKILIAAPAGENLCEWDSSASFGEFVCIANMCTLDIVEADIMILIASNLFEE